MSYFPLLYTTLTFSTYLKRRVGKILAEFGAYEEKIADSNPLFSALILSPFKRLALFNLGHKIDSLSSSFEAPFRVAIGTLYTGLMLCKLISHLITAPFSNSSNKIPQALSGTAYGLAQAGRGLVDAVTTPLTWGKCAIEFVVSLIWRTDPLKTIAARGLEHLKFSKRSETQGLSVNSVANEQRFPENTAIPIAQYSKACKLDASTHAQSHHVFFQSVKNQYLGYNHHENIVNNNNLVQNDPIETYFEKFISPVKLRM